LPPADVTAVQSTESPFVATRITKTLIGNR
jgi:hypothetical protein